MSNSTLDIEVRVEAEAAAKALLALAEAAERATTALDGLEHAGCGVVTIKAVGDVVHIEIAPKSDAVSEFVDDIKSGGPLSQAMIRAYELKRKGA